jgi:hypothetical protein
MPEFPFKQPQAEITLKVAEEGDKRIWVYESPEEVVKIVNECDQRLVTFSRVRGIGNPGQAFSTRPDNIANVRDIRE